MVRPGTAQAVRWLGIFGEKGGTALRLFARKCFQSISHAFRRKLGSGSRRVL